VPRSESSRVHSYAHSQTSVRVCVRGSDCGGGVRRHVCLELERLRRHHLRARHGIPHGTVVSVPQCRGAGSACERVCECVRAAYAQPEVGLDAGTLRRCDDQVRPLPRVDLQHARVQRATHTIQRATHTMQRTYNKPPLRPIDRPIPQRNETSALGLSHFAVGLRARIRLSGCSSHLRQGRPACIPGTCGYPGPQGSGDAMGVP
jgi:hypothetical protein